MTELEKLNLEMDTWLEDHVQIIDGFKKDLIVKWSKIVAKYFATFVRNKFLDSAIPTIMQRDDCDDLVPILPDMSKFGYKEGDKVKVIIIKE